MFPPWSPEPAKQGALRVAGPQAESPQGSAGESTAHEGLGSPGPVGVTSRPASQPTGSSEERTVAGSTWHPRWADSRSLEWGGWGGGADLPSGHVGLGARPGRSGRWLRESVVQGPGKGAKNSRRQLALTIYGRDEAQKGRRLRGGGGPAGVWGSPEACARVSPRPQGGACAWWAARAPAASPWCPGRTERGPRAPPAWGAVPGAVPARPLRPSCPPGESEASSQAERGPDRPRPVPVPPSPLAQHNHLVSGNGKGFSYQRKLKVTLFLIDLAMFVNYSVTDVAKDN